MVKIRSFAFSQYFGYFKLIFELMQLFSSGKKQIKARIL